MQEMDLVIFMGGFFVGVLGLIADLFVKYQRKLERLITSLPEYGKERQDLPSNSFREY